MDNTEQKLIIYVNSNVDMSRGKMAAQAVHAALIALGVHPGIPVVVLGASPTEIEPMRTTVRDAGRTEVLPGTLTAGTDYEPTPPTTAKGERAQLLELVHKLRSDVKVWWERCRQLTDEMERIADGTEEASNLLTMAQAANQANLITDPVLIYRYIATKARAALAATAPQTAPSEDKIGELVTAAEDWRNNVAPDGPATWTGPGGRLIAAVDAYRGALSATLSHEGDVPDPPTPDDPTPADPGPVREPADEEQP